MSDNTGDFVGHEQILLQLCARVKKQKKKTRKTVSLWEDLCKTQ